MNDVRRKAKGNVVHGRTCHVHDSTPGPAARLVAAAVVRPAGAAGAAGARAAAAAHLALARPRPVADGDAGGDWLLAVPGVSDRAGAVVRRLLGTAEEGPPVGLRRRLAARPRLHAVRR